MGCSQVYGSRHGEGVWNDMRLLHTGFRKRISCKIDWGPLIDAPYIQVVQVPTGEKEYATICEPCGRRGELGKSHMNGVGRGGESCVSRVEVLCSKAGVTSKLLDACNRPAAFCEVNSRRKRSTKREKHFVTVGGRFWPQKEEGLTWRSSLPRRRGRSSSISSVLTITPSTPSRRQGRLMMPFDCLLSPPPNL